MAMSELDVARDVIDFQFILNSDVNITRVSYFLEIKKWTHQGMEVQINFTDPLIISKADALDSVLCKVRNRKLFVSEVTGRMLEIENTYISDLFPKQLPHGVSEDSLKS